MNPTGLDVLRFEGRKREHIVHALDSTHQAQGLSGFDRIRLCHDALPELNLSEITLESSRLGKPSPTPFFVAGMTAGHPDALELNLRIAAACSERGWAMGVGSQRRELEHRDSADVDQWVRLRERFPELTLYANLGITQLIHAYRIDIARVIDRIQAQALVVHTNALQEAIQLEGTPSFKGALQALARVCRESHVSVILKETGCGFGESALSKLREIGIAALDVSGLGGTHWGRIEGARSASGSLQDGLAETFASWGVPTADSLQAARKALPNIELWASGGVRTGLDAAKAIALGAHQVGYAQPVLRAALEGESNLRAWMERQETELRVALFCTGSSNPYDLRGRETKWKISVV